jgi:hypothetical protein
MRTDQVRTGFTVLGSTRTRAVLLAAMASFVAACGKPVSMSVNEVAGGDSPRVEQMDDEPAAPQALPWPPAAYEGSKIDL